MAGGVPERVRLQIAAGCAAALCAWPGAAAQAQSARAHAIPSCYEQLAEYAPHEASGDLTVLIDQTIYVDARMRQIVHETVGQLMRPGTTVTIAAFSAYLKGRYLEVLLSGRVEAPIAGRRRDFVPKRELRDTDRCLDEQLDFARKRVAKTVDGALSASDPQIARSDILAALHDLSRRVGEAPAADHIVVVVSDMLENSSITSFYQAGRLRRIDPETELRRAAAARIGADFHRARIVVIGAGAVSERSADSRSYRDPGAMLALEEFWRRWFAASNADLAEFGKPEPLVEVRWASPGPATADAR